MRIKIVSSQDSNLNVFNPITGQIVNRLGFIELFKSASVSGPRALLLAAGVEDRTIDPPINWQLAYLVDF